jgi:hypothetical protein
MHVLACRTLQAYAVANDLKHSLLAKIERRILSRNFNPV